MAIVFVSFSRQGFVEVVKVRCVSDATIDRTWSTLQVFLGSESIVSVTMVDEFGGGENSHFGKGWDDRRISLRRINAAIKGRECRVLAPLKRRLAPPLCNLRRDYDVRLRNPVRTGNGSFPFPGEVSALQHIDSNRRRSYRMSETAIIRTTIIEFFPRR